jgi:hypothetical protein
MTHRYLDILLEDFVSCSSIIMGLKPNTSLVLTFRGGREHHCHLQLPQGVQRGKKQAQTTKPTIIELSALRKWVGVGSTRSVCQAFQNWMRKSMHMYAFKTFTITELDRKWKPHLLVENKTRIILLPQEKIKIFFYAQKINWIWEPLVFLSLMKEANTPRLHESVATGTLLRIYYP